MKNLAGNTFYSRGIQVEEFTTSVSEKQMSIQLLDKESLQNFIRHGFRYIHFGCVQIGVKSLVRLGVDCPIMLALRDKSLISFKDSLLALANTNIFQGPIYFNCFPNLCKDLEDPYILQSLVLDVNLSKEVQFLGARNFSIIHRIYYKVLNTQMNPRCKIRFAPGQTTLFKVKQGKANTYVPQMSDWNEITIPDEWQIQTQTIPKTLTEKKIDQIIEEPDGKVLIRFNSSRELPSTSSNTDYQTARSSYSSCSFDRSNTFDNSQPISQGYKVHEKSPIPEIVDDIPSPTRSDMDPPWFSTLNVLTKVGFQIDKDTLQNDFSSEINSEKRKWFFSNFDKPARDFIREQWYAFMNKLSTNVPFFNWLPIFLSQNNISYPFSSLCVKTNLNQKWTLQDGRIISSTHPPLEGLQISRNE